MKIGSEILAQIGIRTTVYLSSPKYDSIIPGKIIKIRKPDTNLIDEDSGVTIIGYTEV